MKRLTVYTRPDCARIRWHSATSSATEELAVPMGMRQKSMGDVELGADKISFEDGPATAYRSFVVICPCSRMSTVQARISAFESLTTHADPIDFLESPPPAMVSASLQPVIAATRPSPSPSPPSLGRKPHSSTSRTGSSMMVFFHLQAVLAPAWPFRS
jgi:hypothetical protein